MLFDIKSTKILHFFFCVANLIVSWARFLFFLTVNILRPMRNIETQLGPIICKIEK